MSSLPLTLDLANALAKNGIRDHDPSEPSSRGADELVEPVTKSLRKLVEEQDRERAAQLESVREQLESAKEQLESTKEQLESTKEQLESTKEQLESAREQLDGVRGQLGSTREQLGSTREELESTMAAADQRIKDAVEKERAQVKQFFMNM